MIFGDGREARLREIRSSGRGNLSESESKDLLRSYGIRTPDFVLITSEDIGIPELEYPLAVKLDSPEVLHKTEVGGVFLDVMNEEQLARRYDEITRKFPGSRVLVEPMQPKGIEVIVGMMKDPTFGPILMFGLGGIFTELLKDVSFRALPITPSDAMEMIDETLGGRLLRGFRGRRGDMEAVVDLLGKISRIGDELGEHIEQMDLNPVIVYESGYTVVDAKVVLERD